jgi:uncharacterized protein with LGFP repeats
MRGSARRIVAGIAAVATACGIMLAGAGGTQEAAQAADMSGFRAGAIISDAVFFDEGTMTAPQVQSFLAKRVPACRSGYTCLKDYRQDTFSRGADPMCGPYQGARAESAADIIVKVGRACGINPQVLVVLLQKEQGLVLSTAPSARAYRSATGYGCPDTAACDAQYYGFYNQVYKAAWAFQRYSNPAGTGPGTAWGSRYTRYAKGTTVQVLYHPDASCGSSAVYISNQATSSLYYYTPYQPDRAALASGYGTGGSCSSYGNRNFYAYFTDWFGSSTFDVSGWIGDKHRSIGGASGILGPAIGPERAVPGGAAQDFRNGTIVSSSAGAFVVRGWIRDAWIRSGSSGGPSGSPVADEQAIPGGAVQRFARGSVYSSAAGAYTVRGWIGDRYTAAGGSGGVLRFPTADEVAVRGGARQAFGGGDVVSSAAGAFVVRGWIGDRYRALGRESGVLGFPRADERAVAGGAYQDFTGGLVSATSSGTSTVRGWIADAYRARGAGSGAFGLSTADERATPQGAQQQFQGGRFYSSSRGAFGVRGWIGDRYVRTGEQSGVLGSPVGIETDVAGGAAQRFDGGGIYSSARGAFVVRGWIGERYVALGAAASRLGLPVGEERSSGGEVVQEFAGGRIVVGPQGVQVVYA